MATWINFNVTTQRDPRDRHNIPPNSSRIQIVHTVSSAFTSRDHIHSENNSYQISQCQKHIRYFLTTIVQNQLSAIAIQLEKSQICRNKQHLGTTCKAREK